MTQWRFERYRAAYLEMAAQAHYRPAAPNDGCGNILLDDDELADPARLHREAQKYALRFVAQDDKMEYSIGCPDGKGNRAFCYIIEAANALCAPEPKLAIKLLKMAVAEVDREYSLRQPLRKQRALTQ
jgi:hypothetical protein